MTKAGLFLQKIPDRERFNGHPIFPRGPSSGDLQVKHAHLAGGTGSAHRPLVA